MRPISRKTILVVGALLVAVALNAQLYPSIRSFNRNGVLTFSEVTNAASYTVEWSKDMTQSSWSTSSPPGVVGIPAVGFGSRSVTVGVARASLFYRVAATMKPSNRPRGTYLINFQPSRTPASPLVVDGKYWMQVDWQTSGGAWLDYVANFPPFYGWIRDSENQQVSRYDFFVPGNFSDLERSYVYDYYGRQNTFEFELEPGRYLVTIGVGRPSGSSDPHNLTVEGQVLVNDEVLTKVQERAIEIQLTDGSLTVTFGGRSASTGTWAYTFLAYMKVEPVN